MKQFWLGMTSKITELRDKFKKKDNQSEEVVENTDIPLEEGVNAAVDNQPKKKEYRPRMPNVVSASSLDELAVNLDEPVVENENINEENFSEIQNFEPKKPFNVKKFVIISLLLLLVGGVGGVFYYISNIDWNQHKDKIAAQFSEITGKKIVFNGPVHLTLFPAANLTAEDIKIYNPNDVGGEPLAQIKSLVADLNVRALIKGDFDVRMMSLVEPDIRFVRGEDGQINWESELSDVQRHKMEKVEIVLDSVMVKNAKLSYVDVSRDLNLQIDRLNAEIIAQSLFGPYRIEGTYMKDNNPEGFAFSIGKLSSGLATTLNLVINQPATETYVRFDGAVMAQNNAVNGNLIFESKKLMNFVNSNFDGYNLDKAYDYPLAVSLEIKSNKTKIDFTSFVVKYGTTAGAGNLLIPLFEETPQDKKDEGVNNRPKVEFAFNFTELDMDPVVAFMKTLFARFNVDEANYNPDWNFDLLADIKSIKARYNDQLIKEFKFSFDMIDNNIKIRDLSAVLPGDTAVNVKGDLYSDLGHFSYKLDTSLKSDEFLQTLKWLDIQPILNSDTALRRISATAMLGGNFQKIGINPLEVSIDKSSLKGEIGIINADRTSLYVNMGGDLINFDNYLLPLPKDISASDFETKMNYRMKKLGFLNNVDADLRLNLDLGIYESMPFENVKLSANLKNGVLDIRDLNIASLANSSFNFSGIIKGFGENFVFENLKYETNTKDFASFLNKLDIKAPNIDLKVLKDFNSKGIATGFLNKFAVKAVSKLDNINFTYGGQVLKKDNEFAYVGDFELRAPSFVKMLKAFHINYDPKAFSLGQFNIKTKVNGTPSYFAAQSAEINIGPNNFKGNIEYDGTQPRKKIKTDMEINKFELDKFFYNDALVQSKQNVVLNPKNEKQRADLWIKPSLDKTKINYAFYETFDFIGNFKINRLTYKDFIFDFSAFDLSLDHSLAKLNNFKADFRGGKIFADGEWAFLPEGAIVKGNVELQKYQPGNTSLMGDKYGLSGGEINAKISFDAPATSFEEMLYRLNANVDFSYENPEVFGWNIDAIYKDIMARQTSDGLTLMIKNNLQSGKENYSVIKGNINIVDGRYALNDFNMQNQQYNINLNGGGNIETWDTDTQFKVKFAAPEYLPEFEYRFAESLANPVLSVNAEALAAMYNQRQAEVEARNEAAAKAERDRLNKMMNDELLKVKATEGEIHNVLRSEIESKSVGVEDPEAAEIYKQLMAQVEKMEAKMAELQLKGKAVDFSESLVQEIASEYEQVLKDIEVLKENISKNHIKNQRFIINKYYNEIVERNNMAKKIAADYRTRYADFTKRLSKIQTSYRMVEDQNIKRLRNKIEGNLLSLDNAVTRVQNDVVSLQTSNNVLQLEKYAGEIKLADIDTDKYIPSIQATIDELITYVDGRIKLEENIYQKKKEQEEIKRKLEENTGTISVKDTGVSKTVVRGIEEIEKAEEAVDKKDVKVLDFSGEDKKSPENKVLNVDKPQAQSSQDEQPKQGIVVKATGKISKASGIIIKK